MDEDGGGRHRVLKPVVLQCLAGRADFIVLGEVRQWCDFELGYTAGIDSGERQGFPKGRFVDAGLGEGGDS